MWHLKRNLSSRSLHVFYFLIRRLVLDTPDTRARRRQMRCVCSPSCTWRSSSCEILQEPSTAKIRVGVHRQHAPAVSQPLQAVGLGLQVSCFSVSILFSVFGTFRAEGSVLKLTSTTSLCCYVLECFRPDYTNQSITAPGFHFALLRKCWIVLWFLCSHFCCCKHGVENV